MNTTDELLSAFLDSELPEAQMQALRDRLREDPELAERLAALASADDQLLKHYSAIDERPLPTAVTEMLSDPEPAPVVALPWWRKVRHGLHQQVGLAVAAVLVLGFGIAQLIPFPGSGQGADWEAVAEALEATPSGEPRVLPDDGRILPRLTFVNRDGQYCRQYRLERDGSASENIACRDGADRQDWTNVASRNVAMTQSNGTYQTATGGSVLDDTLDRMMQGEAVDPSQERQLIARNWKTAP